VALERSATAQMGLRLVRRNDEKRDTITFTTSVANEVPLWIFLLVTGFAVLLLAAMGVLCWRQRKKNAAGARIYAHDLERSAAARHDNELTRQQPNPELAGYYAPAAPPSAQLRPQNGRQAQEDEARQQLRGFYEPPPQLPAAAAAAAAAATAQNNSGGTSTRTVFA